MTKDECFMRIQQQITNNNKNQAWDAVNMIKQREEECHEKGVNIMFSFCFH